MTKYLSVPAFRRNAPSKAFSRPSGAFRHARPAARTFHVPMAVWRVQAGRMRLLKRYEAAPVPA